MFRKLAIAVGKRGPPEEEKEYIYASGGILTFSWTYLASSSWGPAWRSLIGWWDGTGKWGQTCSAVAKEIRPEWLVVLLYSFAGGGTKRQGISKPERFSRPRVESIEAILVCMRFFKGINKCFQEAC